MKTAIGRVLPVIVFPAVLIGCSKEEPAAAELAAIELAYEASEEERYDRAVEFKPKYEALVEEYWGTEAALDAKLWLLSETTEGDDGEQMYEKRGEMADAIFERYGKSPHMEKLGGHLKLFTEEQADRYFGDLRENSPHEEVRAAAILYPVREKANLLRRGKLEDTPENRGAVEADLQLLIDEYGDVPRGGATYGVLADAMLNPHPSEELEIGQPAPEIVGKSADGEEMLLSQFKGKVTVFYFWGDW